MGNSTYSNLHFAQKSQLIGQPIKEGEYLNNENKYKASSDLFTSVAKKIFIISL